GSADAVLTAALARPSAPVVVVTEDLDAARRLAGDARFFLGGAQADEETEDGADASGVLVLATPETSPYADANPDRRAAMSRMATLSHLAAGRPFCALVLPASALARKLVPPDVVRAHTHTIRAEDELDRDALVTALSEAGY